MDRHDSIQSLRGAVRQTMGKIKASRGRLRQFAALNCKLKVLEKELALRLQALSELDLSSSESSSDSSDSGSESDSGSNSEGE